MMKGTKRKGQMRWEKIVNGRIAKKGIIFKMLGWNKELKEELGEEREEKRNIERK